MEIIRAQAVTRLGELQKIKPKVYTAMELHQRRQMISRVQRQEQRRYHQETQKRKLKLKKDIKDIDFYLASTSAQRTEPITSTMTISAVPKVIPIPTIVFGPKPILRKTRLERYKKKGRF